MRFCKPSSRIAFIAATLVAAGELKATTEICGNDVDDDGNGLTDEGCYPTLTTGVCESPLSCGDTGMVSWSTGYLHYDLAPDIAPAVPFGPGIGFRRFYTPSYSPGGAGPASVNHTPLGPGWQHTYMTWIDSFTDGGGTKRVVYHTSQGRDVYYTWTSNSGGFDYYNPQAGDHVLTLKYDTTNQVYYVQLLSGETLKFNSVGQIIEIWDTLPTPNKVLITWTGSSAGNVSTVTDASGQRRLNFTYTNNLLTTLTFQINVGGTWTTYHTTTYDYSNGVTRDATSGWFTPANATEWTNLLTGTGIPNPSDLWLCQETSGNLADSIGSFTLTAHGSTGVSYAQSVSGWSRKALKITDNQTSYFTTGTTLCNPKTTSCTGFGLVSITANPSATHDVMMIGDGNGARAQAYSTGIPAHPAEKELWDGTKAATGTTGSANVVGPWYVVADPTNLYTQVTAFQTITPTWATGTSASGNFSIGGAADTSAPAAYLYLAEWSGTALTTSQRTTVSNKIQNGPGILSKVTIGGQLAQQMVYTNGLVTQINDGGGQRIVAFSYSATMPGQVDLVQTSRGTVGFEFASSRTGCTGQTMLYFNQGNTSGCSADADCGTGYMCGGKTGTGSTGKCFLAGRCLTVANVNGESVVTNMAPIGPGGGSCSGACTDVMQYTWSASSTLLNVTGRADPLSPPNYTSATYNSNGLVTQMGYGDTDGDPTNGGWNRTEWRFYDSTYPGRIAEIRRPSDLSPNASSCSSTNTTGCVRTIYCYGSSCSASCNNDNQLCTLEQDGFTLDASGAVVSYANKITYVHDAQGRLSEIDGGISGVKTVFSFYPNLGTTPLLNYMLSDYKIYKDATNYLQPQVKNYDFFGHPISLKAPDGNYTCDTYDSARGFLSSRRKNMAGEDCSTSNGADLVTTWIRDSALRLLQMQRPDLTCVEYTYDSNGRPYQIMRRDDCNAATAGDTQQFVYTADSQVSELDTYDSSNTLTAKQPYTYFAGRQIQEIVNPVDTSKFTGLVYDSAGKVTEVDGAGSLAKTVNHFANAPGRDNRITSVDRYKDSSTFDTWSLLYSWLGGQSQVTDGDSKVTGSTRDDLNRFVKLSSPDLANPTINVFDASDRLTTIVEDLGGGTSQLTHSFTFDNLNRPLVDDYAGACPTTGTAHAEIQRTYDALPNGVTCPMTLGCNNLSGRLAYIQTVLMCSSTYSATDGSLDQFTYYSYDDAGRLVEEYITDDAGRTADYKYQYTVNGDLSSVINNISGLGVIWSYGSTGNDSDGDLITSMAHRNADGSNTTIADTITWFPFGPLKHYNWEAQYSGSLQTNLYRNLAYRLTMVQDAQGPGVSNGYYVSLTEDAMGRVTSRTYFPNDPTIAGLYNSFFLYDEQSRVTCETTTSQSTCPTTGGGSALKNNHSLSPPFMHAGWA